MDDVSSTILYHSNSFFPSIYWVPAICQTLQKAESEIKLPTSIGLEKKQGNSMEKTSICFIDYAKAFDCVDHNKLWEILQEMGIPDHLSCLLRNLYVGQETTVRTRHGTMDWFQIGKGVCQGCILSSSISNLHVECVHTCFALSNPMDCSPPGSSAHGIL